MSNLSDLEKRISLIEKRNRRVEFDKKWEGSFLRRLIVALLTYLVIAAYFNFVLKIDPWVNATVPTLGFLLSTLTLSTVKEIWLNKKCLKEP